MGEENPTKGVPPPQNNVLMPWGLSDPHPPLNRLSPPLFGHRIEMQKKDSQKESLFLAEKSLITG